MDVQLPEPGGRRKSTGSDDPAEQGTQSKRNSLFSRSLSFRSNSSQATKNDDEQAHHFVTVTCGGKTMDLLCSSQAEAEQWHQGFREAMLCGKECGDEPSALPYECYGRDS